MPSLITHTIFAKKSFSRCVNKCGFLSGNFDIYLLGNQGPSVFDFLEHPLIFDNNYQFTKENFANKIMAQNYEDFLLGFEEVIQIYNEPQKKNVAFSFFLGLLANYELSRKTNPFIYYRSGFQNDGTETKIDKNRRIRYETFIDFSFRKHLSYSPSENRKIDGLKISHERLLLISNIVYEAFKHVYPESTIQNKTYYDCVVGYQKFVKTTSALPRELMYALGLKYTLAGSSILPRKLHKNESIDYLNLTHQEWHHPVSFAESNKSFVELFNESIDEFEKASQLVVEAYKGKNVKKNFVKYIDDISYLGVKNHKTMMYQKPIIK